jgi:hypothetical protein
MFLSWLANPVSSYGYGGVFAYQFIRYSMMCPMMDILKWLIRKSSVSDTCRCASNNNKELD